MKRSILYLFLLLVCSCGKRPEAPEMPVEVDRVVSLAPSVTECIYAIGGGDRVVGVTTFCNYPPAADQLPKVGGYTDTNYELIYTLQPDLAILLDEHVDAAVRLAELGIPHIKVNTSTLSGIFESLRTLGTVFGEEERAEQKIAELRQRMDEIRAQTADAPPRRVLISIGRNMGSGGLTDVYVAGGNTLFNEMLELLGAENVYAGKLAYAKLSHEGIIRLAPDVVIDLIPDLEYSEKLNLEEVRREWDILQSVPAVKNGEVYVFGGDYVCVPGPRFILTFENISKAVYPECFKEEQ